MADKSSIEWTDATWNIITGCTLVDDGCRHCYAAHLITSWPAIGNHPSRTGLARKNAAGESKFTGEVRFNEQWLDQPLRWKKPRRIFVCAHGDLFHESVPDEWLDRVFAVMALAPQHTFQVLTKRPERAQRYLASRDTSKPTDPIVQAGMAIDNRRGLCATWPLPNVWLGTSISDQASADLRIPHLLATPAAIRFVSAEPLLGPVDLMLLPRPPAFHYSPYGWHQWLPKHLHWLIVGGESGPHARPMHPDWARSLRDQCETAGVPFFFKQWGEWVSAMQIPGTTGISSAPPKPGYFAHPHRRRVHGGALDGDCYEGLPDHHDIIRVGKRTAGRKLDGREHNAMPGAAE